MAHLVDVAVGVGDGLFIVKVALRPGGEGVLGAPLLDVVPHQGVHGHVEESGLLTRMH